MADDEAAPAGRDENSPGVPFKPFVAMEDLIDKLKLLNYDQAFLKKLRMRPLSRVYFAIASNPGEQFYAFAALSCWLLKLAGRQVEMPQEDDDPNATVATILENCRQLGYSVDFPPSKLKSGCGDSCLWVLDKLSNEALGHSGHSWRKPEYIAEESGERETIDEDDSPYLLNMHEEIAELARGGDSDVEEEDQGIDLERLKKQSTVANAGLPGGVGPAGPGGFRPEEMLESTTDANDWRMEVERVLPQLKLTISSDAKDWRVHQEQLKTSSEAMSKGLAETRTQLEKLAEDIASALEKIASREKYLNTQLESLMTDYRALQNQLVQTKDKYRQASGGVVDRQRRLQDIQEEFERIKAEMDDRGSTMTDGSPLVRVKQAVGKLKQELVQLEIRCGVLEHTLLVARVRDLGDLSAAADRAEASATSGL